MTAEEVATIAEAITAGVEHALAPLRAQLAQANDGVAALAKRIAWLESNALHDGGTFQTGESYGKGALVTHGGTLWVARVTGAMDRPGTSSQWLLKVKNMERTRWRERDSKDAR